MATNWCPQTTGNGVTEAKSQLNALTSARGIAAWLVVLYHVRGGFTDAVPDWLISFFAKGYLAVDFFFILSGFVMWLNYGRKFQEQGLRAAPDFLLRRIARIYPLHFVLLVAMVAFAALLAASGRDASAQYPVAELPMHFLLMQNWGFTEELAWNQPAWSISTELAAYLSLPIVAVLAFKRQWSIGASIAAIAALCLLMGFILVGRAQPTIGSGIPYNGLIRCLFEFHIGVFLCMIWQQADARASRLLTWFSATVIGVLGLAWGTGLLREHFVVAAIFAASVYLIARTSALPGNPLSSRLMVHIGDISYSTYLVHFFLWTVFKLLFVRDQFNVPLPLMILFLVMTAVASSVLYRFIEQPGRHWVQDMTSRLRAALNPAKQGA